MTGRWWRAKRYEIREGSLRGVGEFEEYDPWDGYVRARLGGSEPPYQALLALLERLPEDPTTPLTRSEQTALLGWCARFGVLGILPHEAQWMSLAPRYLSEGGEGYRATLRICLRVGDRWHAYKSAWGDYVLEWEPEAGGLVEEDYVPADAPKPTIVLTPLRSKFYGNASAPESMPLGDGLGPYFPDIPPEKRQTYFYPLPLTIPFWREYAEPLEAFLRAAHAFRDAALAVSRIKKTGIRLTSDRRQAILKGLRILNALTVPVRPLVAFDGTGRLRQRWSAGSLLAAFALMLQQDADDGWRVVQCEACGEVFTSHDSRTRWCSVKCRWRMAQRGSRRQRKTR
jgi:hypothetical protein